MDNFPASRLTSMFIWNVKTQTSELCALVSDTISGTRCALSSWLLTGGPTSFCLCKPFSCKTCPEKHPIAICISTETQSEFALPARDYRVEAGVSGWYERLLQSHLAAPRLPSVYFGWTLRPQGMYNYLSIQNPDTPRAGRVGAAHGGAAGRGGARIGRDAVGSIRPGDNPSLLPSSESRTLS